MRAVTAAGIGGTSRLSREKTNSSNGVVVSGNLVVHHIGIAIGIDDRDHGDTQLAGLFNRDFFLFGIYHETAARKSRLRIASA